MWIRKVRTSFETLTGLPLTIPESHSDDLISPFDARYLDSLDTVRVFALGAVIFYHGNILQRCPDGVNLFFVLSGFLFAWLLDREYERSQTVSLRHYYVRRCLRILPACGVSIAFTIMAKAFLQSPVDWRHANSALCFYANYYNIAHDHPPTGFSHYWSLSVEEQFYLIWPILFLLLRRSGRGMAIGCLTVLIAAVLVWRCYALLVLRLSSVYIYNAFETRFDSLAIGCLYGLMVQYRSVKFLIGSLCRTGLEPLILMAGMYVVCLMNDTFQKSVGFTLESLLGGALILSLVQLGRHRLWRWMNHPWLAGLGVLTYSGYLYHHWGLAVGFRMSRWPQMAQVAVGLLATLVLAAVSYFLIERPFQRLRHRLS